MSRYFQEDEENHEMYEHDPYGPEEHLDDPHESHESGSHLDKENSLDKLNDLQLVHFVSEKEMELKYLRLENEILMTFLEANDPAEVEGIENLVNFAMQQLLSRTGGTTARLAIPCPDFLKSSSTSARRSIKLESFSSISSAFEGKGPRVNLSQRSDMVLKAMEEIQSKLEVFQKKSHRIRRNLKAELEEYSFREQDIKESVDGFDFNILVQGFNPITQRIGAEKFARWMEEWMKSAQLNIEKLRLRTASLKIFHKKVSAILVQRQELGENVHAVDFDQLGIENKHFAKKIELKNIQLVELKRMSGSASLVLANIKKELRKLQDEYNALKAAVKEKQKVIQATTMECNKTERELEQAKEKCSHFKKLTISYRVPDVMEYVDIKRQLNDLENKIKVWNRRRKIQDITINACLRQMKNITGSSKIDKAWLGDLAPEGTKSCHV